MVWPGWTSAVMVSSEGKPGLTDEDACGKPFFESEGGGGQFAGVAAINEDGMRPEGSLVYGDSGG